ncbi:MAG TPA: arginase family protein [Streptosporangiaceae bacterium]|nr:arginase family protein [Streptosporangiaceae bacterium]
MNDWVMIGVPTSAGAHHAGQELAPDALRAAGLADRLAAAGLSVADAGNLPGAVFAADHCGADARNLAAVARVAAGVADAVAEVMASGRLPLLLGGDCTITIGAVAGFQRHDPDGGLIYVDGDADLGVPGDGGSGILDSMGISHLLGRGAPELAGLGGQVPLLEPARLTILGSDPRETSDAGREFLAEQGVSFQEAPAFIADPAGAAERALAAVTKGSGRFLVHFDIDIVDSGDLPLGNFPHYGSGVLLDHVVAGLRVLRTHPSFAGLVLTEVNPTHDPDGSELNRLVDALVTALAG